LTDTHLKTILFDLDGTLINSLPAYILSFQQNIREVTGRDVSAEELTSRISVPTPRILSYYAPPEQIPGMVARHNDLMRQNADRITFYPGVPEALCSLHAAGLKLGVVTSQIEGEIATARAAMNIEDLIDVWIHSDLVARPKPAPDPVLLALEMLGQTPETAMMVGDSIYDLGAGRAAGVRTAAVTWGFSALPALLAAGPDLVLRDPAELAQLPGMA
jgi:HAD superfamily hydrolase (TIGR01509 family)